MGHRGIQLRWPMVHQQRALEFALPRDQVALFMEMRLGKSLVAIRWAKTKLPYRVLVVGPLSCLPDWERELERERVGPVVPLASLPRWQRLDAAQRMCGWFTANYEALVPRKRPGEKRLTARPEILQLPWDVLILDESTVIKNPKAQVTKTMLGDTGHIVHKVILSGLPDPEDPMDVVTQGMFLNGTFMNYGNWWGFRQRYYTCPVFEHDWFPKKGTRTAMKEHMGEWAFVLSRKEAGMGFRKVYERRYAKMTPEQTRLYRQVETDFACDDLTTKWSPVQATWMARLAGGFTPDVKRQVGKGKLQELMSLLTGELRRESVVVWFRFNAELFAARDALDKAGITREWITGEVSAYDRSKRLRSFQTGKARVFLAQSKCARFGLDCSVASTAIYFSNWWNLETRAQSEDRIIHPKKPQDLPLLYIDLVSKDTVDEDVIEALRMKKVDAKTFLSSVIRNLQRRTT